MFKGGVEGVKKNRYSLFTYRYQIGIDCRRRVEQKRNLTKFVGAQLRNIDS